MKLQILALALATGAVGAFAPAGVTNGNSKVTLQISTVADDTVVVDDVDVVANIPNIGTSSLAKVEQTMNPQPYMVTSDILRNSARSQAIPFLVKPEGLTGWVGDVGFDPLGFSAKYEMKFLREAELKHGRVCMLAWVGWVAVDLGMRVYPTPDGWVEIPNSLAAHNALVGQAPQEFWGSPLGNMLWFLGIIEFFQMTDVGSMRVGEEATRDPGDLDFDILNFLENKSDEEINNFKLMEIKHCRLGMLAFAGVVAQTSVIGATQFPYVTFPEIAQ